MNTICLGIWYIIFTSLSIIALVIRMVRSFSIALQELVTYILIASIIYGGYMIIFFWRKRDSKNNGGHISNENSDIIRDHLFKFIFVLALGVIFLSKFIENLLNYFGGAFPEEEWYNSLERACSQYAVPIIILVDIFLIPRKRVLMPMYDLIAFLAILIIFHFIVLVNLSWSFASVERFIASLIKSFIYSFDGYVLYDYVLYKKSGSVSGYHLFGGSSSYSSQQSKSGKFEEN